MVATKSVNRAESSQPPTSGERPGVNLSGDRGVQNATPAIGGDGESLFSPALHEYRCQVEPSTEFQIKRGDVFVVDPNADDPVLEIVMNVNRQGDTFILDLVRVDPSDQYSVEVRMLRPDEFDSMQPAYHVEESDEMFQQVFTLYKQIFRPNLDKLQRQAEAGDPSLN